MKTSSNTLFIYNAHLVDGHGDADGAVLIQDGVIRSVFLGNYADHTTATMLAGAVLSEDEEETKPQMYDAHGLTLMPAFVDMHAHFRYPGQSEKEDLDSGLHAAVAGGFGTLVLMPNTKPVISTHDQAIAIEHEAAKKKLARIFQTVSITNGFDGTDTTNLNQITSKDIPVITEDGKDVADSSVMLEGMRKAGKKGIIVSCHCEDPALAAAAKPFRSRALGVMKKYDIPAWGVSAQTKKISATASAEIDNSLTEANRLLAVAEDIATVRNISLAYEAGCHVHIAHCSTKVSMDAVRLAKKKIAQGMAPVGFSISVEVTPHHLGLSGTEAPYLRALVNPPLRSEADRAALILAIADGTVDCISTDHAPHTAADKAAGAPGFTGLETAYAVCNTVLVQNNVISASRLSELMSANPAKLLHLKTGLLEPGYAADIVLVDPNEQWVVDSTKFFSKGHATPQEGRTLIGRVHATFYGGKEVFDIESKK